MINDIIIILTFTGFVFAIGYVSWRINSKYIWAEEHHTPFEEEPFYLEVTGKETKSELLELAAVHNVTIDKRKKKDEILEIVKSIEI
jgi:hypothetical protein